MVLFSQWSSFPQAPPQILPQKLPWKCRLKPRHPQQPQAEPGAVRIDRESSELQDQSNCRKYPFSEAHHVE